MDDGFCSFGITEEWEFMDETTCSTSFGFTSRRYVIPIYFSSLTSRHLDLLLVGLNIQIKHLIQIEHVIQIKHLD